MRLLVPAFFIAILAPTFYSCNPSSDQGTPFFVKMDSVILNTDNAKGANSQNIADVWVQTTANTIGTFQLPSNFPVLEKGLVHFLTGAGVEVSGQSGDREIYPFYQDDTFTVNAVPGNTYHHKPVFSYRHGTQFTSIVDFQSANVFSEMTQCTDTAIIRYGPCGQITVGATGDSNVIAMQIAKYQLPAGQEIWLEVDYKGDIPFNIGLNDVTQVTQIPVLFVNAHPQSWNKLYVKLSEMVTNSTDDYQLYFEALRPLGSAGGNVYLDNIKIVHF